MSTVDLFETFSHGLKRCVDPSKPDISMIVCAQKVWHTYCFVAEIFTIQLSKTKASRALSGSVTYCTVLPTADGSD